MKLEMEDVLHFWEGRKTLVYLWEGEKEQVKKLLSQALKGIRRKNPDYLIHFTGNLNCIEVREYMSLLKTKGSIVFGVKFERDADKEKVKILLMIGKERKNDKK